MRVIVALLALAFTTSVLYAQSARVTGARITGAGIYEQDGNLKTIQDKNLSSGRRTEMWTRLVTATTTIPLRDNTLFGATFDVLGSPKGANVKLRAVWRYPSPGIVNPQTSAATFTDDVSVNAVIGGTRNTFYMDLGRSAAQLPSGVWVLEVWDGNRKLATQNFTLVRQ